MKKITTFLFLLICAATTTAQKKTMDHSVYKIWKKIDKTTISNDGQWVAYTTVCNAECDPVLNIGNLTKGIESNLVFERGYDAQFSFDNAFLVFKLKQPLDSLKAKRRKGTKDDDLPKDSLCILRLADGTTQKMAGVKSYTLPKKWSGFLAVQLEIDKPIEKVKKDSTATGSLIKKDSLPPIPNPQQSTTIADSTNKSKSITIAKPKPKTENKESGTRLVLLNLDNGHRDTFPFITEYVFAKRAKKLLLTDTGKDSIDLPSVDLVECDKIESTTLSPDKKVLFQQKKAKFKQLALDELGTQAAFIADLDTTKERIRPYQLQFHQLQKGTNKLVAKSNSDFGPMKNYLVSENAKPLFSEDGTKLYFGIAPQPILNDTTLLPEEIVNVEVWSYQDKRIQTQQKVQLDAEKKRSYTAVYYPKEDKLTPLANPDMPEIGFTEYRNADHAVSYTSEPYQLANTWEGSVRYDASLIDLKTGLTKPFAQGIRGQPQLSPAAHYVYWYNELDSAWFAYSIKSDQPIRLTNHTTTKFYDEENDSPDYPNSFGSAGWTKDDQALLIYDHFDIWVYDPKTKNPPKRITDGRPTKTVYRYIQLDNEERFINLDQPLILHFVNETTKSEGYARLTEANKTQPKISILTTGDYRYSPQVLKAKSANTILFTKQNFATAPDLMVTSDFLLPSNGGDVKDVKIEKVSNINPQQAEYAWGTIELVEWRALDGQLLRGMLVKPEGFDPKKKYPMIVNFYEKSSQELNTYRGPEPLRSSINYSFYANRGYLIFNPDIPYRIGYPGESCINSVLSGVANLVNQGFVDEKRIAVQGHSWGGYQAAYLITKTNVFRCAEAGAPVVNMISAYGGIRWESGLLRQFQYEHTQSRIGGTPWEYPLRFMENSPIFSADKINTPVLIMANDKDGAVPWYQGIEFYSAMRRLNKPAWLLNYNEEPHWPVKLQNRIDFQTRMAQYFDYYLKDAPMPPWMQRGIPAMEKGIIQGY
jgi:dipeptidyl aminopeptidase/acylaminoacyl peptidase